LAVREIPHPFRPTLGPIHPLCNGHRVSFPGVCGRGVALTTDPYLAPRLKKSRATSLSPFVSSRPVLGRTLPILPFLPV
jgi:hypothetical protein